MIPVVGLTGGIGSGKSTAAGFLAELGASVVDTDDLSRELTAPGGAALPAIREAFGETLVPKGGALDRAAMRSLAFSDDGARARLEAILHPLIREASSGRLEAATGPYAVLVVPLLFETGFRAGRIDRVVVIDLDPALQVRRAAARSQLTDEAVRAIMATQWPRWRRLQAADHVLWNGGEPGELRSQCAELHERLCAARPIR